MGARAGLDLQIPTGYPDLDVLIGTFVRYWSIKDSTVNISSMGNFTGYEPRNKTYEIGINLEIVF